MGYAESTVDLVREKLKNALQKEDWARETGIKEIRLNSGMARKGAHEFYRRMGFTDEKEQMRFLKTLE